MITLVEFLQSSLRNSYVKHTVGRTLYSIYLRKSTRLIDGKKLRVLDIANISTTKPGRGTFRALETEIVALAAPSSDGIYVESVLNDRLSLALEGMGYTQVNLNYGTKNYYKAVK